MGRTYGLDMRSAAFAIVLASATAGAAPKLARHYAAMFEKDHRWTYTLAHTDFDFVEQHGVMKAVAGKPAMSTFTCTVTNVIAFREAVVSTIHCDTEIDPDYEFRPDGMWVATAGGVYRAGSDGDTLPASAKDLSPAPLLVRASPQVTRSTRKDGYGSVITEAVTNPAKGTWCAVTDTTKAGAGDGAITTECFRDGVGLVRGTLDYHGGTPRIVEYTAK